MWGCNCQHEKVCSLRGPLIEAYVKILEPQYGKLGNDEYREFFNLIKRDCRFRTPDNLVEVKAKD